MVLLRSCEMCNAHPLRGPRQTPPLALVEVMGTSPDSPTAESRGPGQYTKCLLRGRDHPWLSPSLLSHRPEQHKLVDYREPPGTKASSVVMPAEFHSTHQLGCEILQPGFPFPPDTKNLRPKNFVSKNLGKVAPVGAPPFDWAKRGNRRTASSRRRGCESRRRDYGDFAVDVRTTPYFA